MSYGSQHWKSNWQGKGVAPCKESTPTSCGPHRKRFLEVKAEIQTHMESDKNTLLQEEDVSAKRNLMSVGGCADTPLDLDEEVMPVENTHVSATDRLC
jgi:hypothetical protein